MNQAETYFQDLTPLNHASQVDATHGVVPVHMARLMMQARGLVPMWRHVGLSRADCCCTQTCHMSCDAWVPVVPKQVT
jgi:hypothetical protein